MPVPWRQYHLQDGFPDQLSDRELRADIQGIVDSMLATAGRDVGGWLPDLKLALIIVGITEQSRRQLVRGSLVAVLSLLVAAAALVVAFVALVS